MKTPTQAVEKFANDNRNAADIVLRDVAKYGGNEAGLVVWARRIVANETRERSAWRLVA